MSLQTAKIQVREIKSMGTSVFIIEQEADFQGSKSLLTERGLRLLSKEEALVHISKTPELKNQLKGKWFYLAGEGLDKNSIFTFDEKGTLIEKNQEQIENENISLENLVSTRRGKQPLSLQVWSDHYASIGDERFALDAYSRPLLVAKVVVGVKQDEPKIAPELLAEFRPVVAKLDAAAQAGVINPEIAETTKKILRALE